MMSNAAFLGVKIVILCLLWYVTSAVNNVVGKLVLQSFAYPTTVTLVQFFSITIYSVPALRFLSGARHVPHISWQYFFKLIVPLAFGKFFASVSSHISLWAVPVSYAHTVKASMPLFVVFLSRIILGERQTKKIYLSLIPIILGVFISSVTELKFNLLGLLSALFSIFVFSLQNIYSKKVLKETSIHHLRLLHMLARLALFMFIPFWLYHDLPDILFEEQNSTIDGWVIGGLLFVDGLCNFFQNVIAFTVLSLVTPLTYSVCNASKRIAVITCSILMLKNPVTPANVFGMSLAIFGVFYYNKAKMDARKEPILPTKHNISKHDTHSTKMNVTRRQLDGSNLLFRFVDNKDHRISNTIVAPKSMSNFAAPSALNSQYNDESMGRYFVENHNGHYRGSKNKSTNGYTRIDMIDV